MPGRSDVRLLNREALAAKLGVRLTKAHDTTKRPGFPRPTYTMGPARWLEHEVDAWLLGEVDAERARYGSATSAAT